jgi:hypothetical protein
MHLRTFATLEHGLERKGGMETNFPNAKLYDHVRAEKSEMQRIDVLTEDLSKAVPVVDRDNDSC